MGSRAVPWVVGLLHHGRGGISDRPGLRADGRLTLVVEALLAALPIAVILVLMLVAGWSAARSAIVGLGVALLLTVTVFGASGDLGLAGLLVGVLAEATWTAATILAIIVPALVIHRLGEASGSITVLRDALVALSSDCRVRLLLIAWFFALLLEGASGFGTAGALAAPFLVGLGVPAVTAVTAALLGHALGVTFGALGTPVVPQVVASGLPGTELAAAAIPYVLLLGPLVPPLLVLQVARGRETGADGPGRWLGTALGAALAFLVPFALLGLFVGPELPTVGGALAGSVAFVAVLLVRGGRVGGSATADPGFRPIDVVAVARAAAPYLALVTLVLLTRLVPVVREALLGLELRWSVAEGTFGVALWRRSTTPGRSSRLRCSSGHALRAPRERCWEMRSAARWSPWARWRWRCSPC